MKHITLLLVSFTLIFISVSAYSQEGNINTNFYQTHQERLKEFIEHSDPYYYYQQRQHPKRKYHNEIYNTDPSDRTSEVADAILEFKIALGKGATAAKNETYHNQFDSHCLLLKITNETDIFNTFIGVSDLTCDRHFVRNKATDILIHSFYILDDYRWRMEIWPSLFFPEWHRYIRSYIYAERRVNCLIEDTNAGIGLNEAIHGVHNIGNRTC